MLIDLEAMLHNWQWERPIGDQAGYLQSAGVGLMSRSVVTVGLLPAPVIWTEGNQVNQFDMSGMSGAGGQLTARPVTVWDGFGTDEMRLDRRRVPLPGSGNLPTLGEQRLDVTEFAPEIGDGYRTLYRILLRHRDELLGPSGPLAAFAHDEVRVVLRATESYVRLLAEAQHPDLLRDASDRDRYFENLWAGHEHREDRDLLIAAELAQMYAGDVPIFVTTPSSTDLTGGDGTVVPGALRQTGLDAVRDRLVGMSEDHLAQQSWIIEASLTALIMGDPSRWRPPSRPGAVVLPPPVVPAKVVHSPVAPATVAPERFVDAARIIGDRLLATALTEDDRICWLGLSLIADKVWMLGPSAMDLYNGISGIALFLARLADVTGDTVYRQAADRAATDDAPRGAELARRPDRDRGRRRLRPPGRVGVRPEPPHRCPGPRRPGRHRRGPGRVDGHARHRKPRVRHHQWQRRWAAGPAVAAPGHRGPQRARRRPDAGPAHAERRAAGRRRGRLVRHPLRRTRRWPASPTARPVSRPPWPDGTGTPGSASIATRWTRRCATNARSTTRRPATGATYARTRRRATPWSPGATARPGSRWHAPNSWATPPTTRCCATTCGVR